MAILSAILGLILRQLSTIVQAVFGWSITALFGKLPSKKQLALSAALALSIAWPVLVLGCFDPGAAAWVLAFLPLKKWLGPLVLRLIWIALAVSVPLAVGAVTRWITPKDKLHGGLLKTLLGGYVLTVGYFFAFVVTALTVPIVKIMSATRRWEDCHVYVQPKEDRYFKVLDALAEACGRADAHVTREDVPWPMALASTAIQKMAKPFLEPIVASQPQRLRGEKIELYLYPADLLLRGEPRIVAHVRAAMTRTGLQTDSYLVQDPVAQKIQDEIEVLSKMRDKAGSMPGGIEERIRQMSARLDRAPISFDEWTTLETSLRRLEREIVGGKDLIESGSDNDASGNFVRKDVARGGGAREEQRPSYK